tara:strand:- start:386 stop:589 length:204 start_codon:yes stop_codon:yes gene_type:complete
MKSLFLMTFFLDVVFAIFSSFCANASSEELDFDGISFGCKKCHIVLPPCRRGQVGESLSSTLDVFLM